MLFLRFYDIVLGLVITNLLFKKEKNQLIKILRSILLRKNYTFFVTDFGPAKIPSLWGYIFKMIVQSSPIFTRTYLCDSHIMYLKYLKRYLNSFFFKSRTPKFLQNLTNKIYIHLLILIDTREHWQAQCDCKPTLNNYFQLCSV